MSSYGRRRSRRLLPALTALAAGGGLLAVAAPMAAAGPSPSTLSVSPTTLAAGSTGNTLAFTYTSGNAVSGGNLTIPLPKGFSAPTAPSLTTTLGSGCTSATPSTMRNKILVRFSCTASGTFVVSDAQVTLGRAAMPGQDQIVASTTGAPITSFPTITVTSGPAVALRVTASMTADSDVATSFRVAAVDKFGNVVTTYTGTVRFASTDPRATLPASYTFVAADNGVHTFTGVLLYTPGRETVTVADTSASLSGTARLRVVAPTSIAVTPSTATIPRGGTQQFSAAVTYPDQTVTADPYVTWSTQNPTVVTINKTGLATGVNLGSTTVSATLAGTTGSASVTVSAAATQVSLASSAPNGSQYGQAVTFTATVTPGAPGSATGTVTFTADGATIGQATVSNGSASITVSDLAVGSHTIIATYSGDANNQPGSAQLTQVVSQVATSVSAASTGDTTYGNAGSLAVTLSPDPASSGATPAIGTITVTDQGGNQVGSASVSGPTTVVNLPANLPAGSNTLTVAYSGDTNYAAGTTTATQNVAAASPTVSDSPSTTTPNVGDTVTFSVHVAGVASGSTPNGSVTVSDGSGNTFGPVSVDSNGNASVQGSFSAAGTYNMVATYTPGANDNYSSASDSGVTITVS